MNKVTVQFHGNLAQFGETFELYANTANEAIRSLAIQIDGLKQYLKKGYYRVKVDHKVVTQSEYIGVLDVSDGTVIHVSPRVAGSGKFGTFILGAVLTGVSFLPGMEFLMPMGIGMMLGGVAQMLIKPKPFNQEYKGVEDSKSSAFTNLSNMVGQGKKVPRIYGELRVGSVVVSQSTSSYRTDGLSQSPKVQTPEYIKKRIELIPAKDPAGKPYNLDLNADSIKEAATIITVEWS